MYHLLGLIDRTVMDYPIAHNTIRKACDAVIRYLRDLGYTTTMEDDSHRDFRIIAVEGHRFRIFRNKGWMRYDVRQID